MDSDIRSVPQEFWDAEDVKLEMTLNPNSYSDGSSMHDSDTEKDVSGAGAFVRASQKEFQGQPWGHVQDLSADGQNQS